MKDQKRYRFVRENEKERIYWDRAEGKHVTTSRKNDLYSHDEEMINVKDISYGMGWKDNYRIGIGDKK